MDDKQAFQEFLVRALSSPHLVQSFSGVRSAFGGGPSISLEHRALAAAYGFAYAQRILSRVRGEALLLVGRDPRPTGESIAEALTCGFISAAHRTSSRVRVLDLGIITTPLIQTAVRALVAVGGVMITASHNPLTDNGFKFLTGLGTHMSAPPGALLAREDMTRVIDDVADLAHSGVVPDVHSSAFSENHGRAEDSHHRVMAERAYLDEIASGWGIQPHCLKPLVFGPVLLDPNGGAASGINARVLEHFGVRAIEVNAELGYPEHAIDTDGIDPASGKHMLIRIARAALRAGARFGIAFDYDADRGNLVLPGLDELAIVPPQTVAAANIALALAHWQVIGRKGNRVAVVISDSTSGAAKMVAKHFGAEVFIVETGEVNIVTRMHQLRQEGYDVPVGVEGANGGTIFGGSTCRDGLQTALCAALADEETPLGGEWLRVLSKNGLACPSAAFPLAEEMSREKEASPTDPLPSAAADRGTSGLVSRLRSIFAAMPRYYNRMFRLLGPDRPHAEIKARMEEHFTHEIWPEICCKYRAYRFLNYEGTEFRETRTGDESGGWRILLDAGEGEDFIFARGSRTEAGIWRMIVDSTDSERGRMLESAAMRMFETAAQGKSSG